MYRVACLIALIAGCIPRNGFSQPGNYEIQKLSVKDRQANDWLGFAASINGDYAIAAAPMRSIKQKNKLLSEVGVVYVFKKNNHHKWEELARIDKPDAKPHDIFGYGIAKGVAIYNRSIVIGGKGTVYVYEIDSRDRIVFKQKIQTAPLNKGFGAQVAINTNFLAITTGISGMTVHLYKKENEQWVPYQQIKPLDNDKILFGYQIAMDDSNTLVISSGDLKNAEVLCYGLNEESKKFELLQQIKLPGEQIGSVSVTNKYLAIGSGGVLIYKKAENKEWVFHQKMETNTLTGICISLTNRYLLVGALGEMLNEKNTTDGKNAGAAYLFANNDDKFSEVKKFTPVNRVGWDKFGFCVGLTAEDAIITSRFEKEDSNEENPLEEAGAVYFIQLMD